MADIIVIAAVLVCLAGVIVYSVRRKKAGKSIGCDCGSSSGCSGGSCCGNSHTPSNN